MNSDCWILSPEWLWFRSKTNLFYWVVLVALVPPVPECLLKQVQNWFWRLDGRTLDQIADELSKLASVHLLQLDVRSLSVESALSTLPASWCLDILINNAGLSRVEQAPGKLPGLGRDDRHQYQKTCSTSPFCRTGNGQSSPGHVNLGSTAGHQTYPRRQCLLCNKAAVRVISEGLKQDLLGTPVRVSSVDPGLVETEFSNVRFRGDTERAKQVYQGLTPPHPWCCRCRVLRRPPMWISAKFCSCQLTKLVLCSLIGKHNHAPPYFPNFFQVVFITVWFIQWVNCSKTLWSRLKWVILYVAKLLPWRPLLFISHDFYRFHPGTVISLGFCTINLYSTRLRCYIPHSEYWCLSL